MFYKLFLGDRNFRYTVSVWENQYQKLYTWPIILTFHALCFLHVIMKNFDNESITNCCFQVFLSRMFPI